MKPIVVQMIQNETRQGAKADANLFVSILEKFFAPDFDEVAKKILFCTSDNCAEATACRRSIISILDRKYPLSSECREPIKCAGNLTFLVLFFFFILLLSSSISRR